MQNRFTIRPVPTSVDLRRLREYVEDHVTWVDRMAFLPSSSSSSSKISATVGGCGRGPGDGEDGGQTCCPPSSSSSSSGGHAVVAIELNQENYRKCAIDFFGANRTVVLATAGDDDDDDDEVFAAGSCAGAGCGGGNDNCRHDRCKEGVTFSIARVAAATREESDELLRICRSNGKDGDSPSEDASGGERGCSTESQNTCRRDGRYCRQLETTAANRWTGYHVWNGIKILHPDGEGGTGARLWRGGVLLADHVRRNPDPFRGRAVIELGAGYHGLPSLALHRMSHIDDGAATAASGCSATGLPGGPRRIVVSDSIDEIVQSLQRAVEMNCRRRPHPHAALAETTSDPPSPRPALLEVEQIDFYDVPPSRRGTFDAVMYADCVYSVEQGLALASACGALTGRTRSRPDGEEAAAAAAGGCPTGGFVLGVLPPFRVGVREHVRAMGDIFGEPEEIDMGAEKASPPSSSLDDGGGSIRCVQGGSASGYRMLKWPT